MPDKNKFSAPVRNIIRKIRGVFGLNIGTVAFGLLFLYMAVCALFYITSGTVESYQVITGPLSRNETYTGLALREETTVNADSGGYVTYFAREGSKINATGAVYGLSSTQTPEVTTELSQEDLSKIRNQMMSFSKGFNSSKFNNTYSFKSELEGNILQYAGASGNAAVTLGNQTISMAASDGIILYSRDGYEGKTIDTITKKDFDQNSYHETNLKTQKAVSAGDAIYTIITDERWSLLIPLSEKQAVKLADRTTIRVKFLKDGMTQLGDFSIVEIDGEKYGKLDFNKGLIRYATERFLEIELVTNNVSGLKIPLSSIVTKEFYTIPSEFATVDEKTQQLGFLLEGRDKDGKVTTSFINPTIYASIEVSPAKAASEESDAVAAKYLYYVDKNAFQEGDAIVSNSTPGKFVIGDIGVLEGVYCINKGYAVFRRIQLLDQNEEYAIVSKNTTYGLARYDHIVKNANKVKEEDILY